VSRLTISVIIASFGRPSALADNVGQLLSQNRLPDEILVIHQRPDSDNEGTQRLRKWAGEGRIILDEPNYANAQKARNHGIRVSKSEILLFLDDDLSFSESLLEAHLNNYETDRELHGVVGQVLEVGQEPTDRLPKQYYWPHLGWQHLPMNYSVRTYLHNWPSTNSSIRRAIAMEIGGFDEQFEITWLDDSDFSHRLKEREVRLVFDPTASVVHLKIQRGGRRPVSSEAVKLNMDGWAVHFYFWLKNYSLWKARYPFCWNLRYQVLRKRVLLRPHWLLWNVWHLFRGYRLAKSRLRRGPIYLS
jgi:GT2 family glycosyltransferase